MAIPSSVDQRLLRTISQVLGVDVSALSDESSPQQIASWDSLNHLNLVMSLESEYGVVFTPDETMRMSSVGAIREVLSQDRTRSDDGEAVQFEDCVRENLLEVNAFVAKSYGPDYVLRTNPAYFDWQYRRSPISEGCDYHLRLAMVEGRIAGFLGYVPVEQSVGGKIYRACWLANWMVDPDVRQVGLGPMLVRNVCSDFDISLAAGANQAARDVLTRMGWTDFGMLLRYVRVINPIAAEELAGRRFAEWDYPRASIPRHVAAVEEVRAYDGRATQLWDEVLGNDSMVAGTRRSARFLNWRYAQHSDFAYRLLQSLDEDGHVRGVGVYRIERVRNREHHIVRLVELFGTAAAKEALLETVTAEAVAQGAFAIDYFTGNRADESLLLKLEFLPPNSEAGDAIPILYQPLDRRRAGIRFLADLSQVPDAEFVHHWYVTNADGDQDRPN